MGWKAIRDHFAIPGVWRVQNGNVLIGSPYIADIIVISPSGAVAWGRHGATDYGWKEGFHALSADPSLVRRLFESPDSFAVSIPVYASEDGEIVERFCEQPGWPNTTHDGELMYENTHFPEKNAAVVNAKENALAGIRFARDSITDAEHDLTTRRERLATYEARLAKLDANYLDRRRESMTDERRVALLALIGPSRGSTEGTVEGDGTEERRGKALSHHDGEPNDVQ